MSRAWGKKAFRFDTLLTNKPAQALYDGLGFTRVSVERWNSGSVGETEFVLYERLL